jgi:mRNA interferase RelE/StbE
VSYSIILDSRVQKDLRELEARILKRVDAAILKLSQNPRPAGSKKLQGRTGVGWRLRIGDYRILYHINIDRREVVIYKIGHRREVYR